MTQFQVGFAFYLKLKAQGRGVGWCEAGLPCGPRVPLEQCLLPSPTQSPCAGHIASGCFDLEDLQLSPEFGRFARLTSCA